MEDFNTPHARTPKTSTLNHLLDQVELLATAHEKQRAEMRVLNSEMETARNAVAAAQQRAKRAEEALSEQTAATELRDQHDQMSLPLDSQKDERQEMPVSNSIYSPHLPHNQAIQALDRKVIQELLNEVHSCIALLES
ncbi:MAG TPA: hypothetical protein DCX00_01820 [Flavobacteriales bacterium]|nr:hypothetical protein [Flavobacteriales bacterium]